MSLSPLFLALLAAFQTQPSEPLTVEAIRTGSSRSHAERLIGSEQAADVERTEVSWDPILPGGVSLRFFHRPVPFSADMCSQRVHYLSLSVDDPITAASLPRDRQPLKVIHIRDNETIALAPGCRTVPGQSFASLNPNLERTVAVQALRNLAAARAAAAGSRRMPFALVCRDEAYGPGNACRGGARNVLAGMPIERAWLIENRTDGVRVIVGHRGQTAWSVVLAGYGTGRARVSLIWFTPAPF